MPDELRDQLSERAREHRRSLNAEILAILQDAIKGDGSPPGGVDVEAWAELIADRVAARLGKGHG